MRKEMMLLFAFLFPLFLAAQEEKDSVPEIEVVRGDLKIGQGFNVGKAAVSFLKVISDSRCPRQVTCIWPGEAKVLLGINFEGQYFEKVVVVSGGENPLPELDRLNLNVTHLIPYPETAQPIASEDYRVRYSASVALED